MKTPFDAAGGDGEGHIEGTKSGILKKVIHAQINFYDRNAEIERTTLEKDCWEEYKSLLPNSTPEEHYESYLREEERRLKSGLKSLQSKGTRWAKRLFDGKPVSRKDVGDCLLMLESENNKASSWARLRWAGSATIRKAELCILGKRDKAVRVCNEQAEQLHFLYELVGDGILDDHLTD